MNYPPPTTELCVILKEENGIVQLYCHDDRISNEGYLRNLKEVEKYICTNQKDFESLQIYNLELRKKIKELETSCN